MNRRSSKLLNLSSCMTAAGIIEWLHLLKVFAVPETDNMAQG